MIAGNKARIKVSGDPLALVNASTTGNVGRTVYTINNTAQRVLVREGSITCSISTDAGSTYTFPAASTYTVNRLLGTVTFAVAQAVGTLVRMHGQYLPMATAAECKEFSINMSAKTADVSDFETGDWVKRVQGQRDVTGSLGKWAAVNSFFADALKEADDVVLEFFSDKANTDPDYRIWAKLTADEMSAAIEGAQSESVSWEATTDLEGNALATFS